MLEATHISYQTGRKCLLKNVSLTVEPGELVAVVGANGAGKSTLLKLLSRELTPSQGHVSLNGIPLKQYSAVDLARRRAVLAQQNPLAFNFRVHELVMMGRYPHFSGQPTADDVAIVDYVHELTGISHLTDRAVPTLSGGEQQRVHLAKVLAQLMTARRPSDPSEESPRYLMLDEPTAGLDMYYQYSLLDMARELTRQRYGVVVILHDLNLVMHYADRVLLLKDGHSVAFGNPAAVLTPDAVLSAFQLPVSVIHQPGYAHPFLVPAHQPFPLSIPQFS